MKKVVFLSGHFFNSERKAGFHFLAKAFKNKGFKVVFITSRLSLLSFLRRDRIINEKGFKKNIVSPSFFEGVKSIINVSVFAPVSRNSKLLDYFATFFFRLNKASVKEICDSEYVIFESVSSIMFFDKIKTISPKATLIYRMSDDLESQNAPEMVLKYEKKIIKIFDLVSVPTKVMFDKFIKLSPNNVKLLFHGIDKENYDAQNVSPYSKDVNHVFVGNSNLDHQFVDIASTLFKEHWFHIIGNFEPIVKNNNVIYYGHMPFKKTIPYVRFATTGLQNRSNEYGVAKTLSDSLKVLQYSYCKLPIIAPKIILASHRKNFFYYDDKDENSIKRCFEQALNFDKGKFEVVCNSWDEVVVELINNN